MKFSLIYQSDLSSTRIETQRALVTLGDLIMRTPTGPVRNALCDANIHLMAAEAKLLEANTRYVEVEP